MADELKPDTRVYPGSDQASPEASRRSLSSRRGIAALSAVSVALIIAAVVLAFASPQTGLVSGGLWQTTTAGSAAGEGSSSRPAAASGSADDHASAADGADQADATAAGDAQGASSSAGDPSEAGRGAGADASDGTASVVTPGAADDGPTSSGGRSPSADPANQAVTVTVTVSARAAGGGTLASTELSFEAGATAYDALMGTGLSVSAERTAYGIYVRAIGGYAAEGSSGWMYAVNGSEPNTSAANYTLHDGDTVSWYFVN